MRKNETHRTRKKNKADTLRQTAVNEYGHGELALDDIPPNEVFPSGTAVDPAFGRYCDEEAGSERRSRFEKGIRTSGDGTESSLVSCDRDAGNPDVRRGGMVHTDGAPLGPTNGNTGHGRTWAEANCTGDGVATLKPVVPCGKVLRAGCNDWRIRGAGIQSVFFFAQSSSRGQTATVACRWVVERRRVAGEKGWGEIRQEKRLQRCYDYNHVSQYVGTTLQYLRLRGVRVPSL